MMRGVSVPPDEQPPTETAILVPIPDAEPVLGRYRAALDQAAGWGVPAHVTILYPLMPPEKITDAVISSASAAVASVGSFDCEFARTEWFGQEVLWLAPKPDKPFRALISAVGAAFPQFPPYGGAMAVRWYAAIRFRSQAWSSHFCVPPRRRPPGRCPIRTTGLP